jgi:hypothetical protein
MVAHPDLQDRRYLPEKTPFAGQPAMSGREVRT